MRKNYFAIAIVAAVAVNIPSATASASPSQAIASIQKVLTTKSAELKAWLAKELKEEGVLGGTYVPQINAANQKLAGQLKELATTYAPLLGSTDSTVAYLAQSRYAGAQADISSVNQKEVADIKTAWEADLKGIDGVYEPAEFAMLDQIAVAKDALLAAKRASKNASTFDTAFATAFSSRMSSCRGNARPPASSTSRAVVWIVPATLGLGSAVLPVTTMLAPSRAKRSAISRPMPRVAPVMKTVLFFKSVKIKLVQRKGRKGSRRKTLARSNAH